MTLATVDLKGRLGHAVSRLMAIRVDGESAIIAVPVLYPSGSSCSVQITFNRDRCFVSDLALGHMEAQMQGADTFYGRSAKEAAQRFGVGFDGLSMFAAWASIDKIEAAISMVANASANAVTAAMFKAMEEKEKQNTQEVYDRISSIFGKNRTFKEMELSGRDDIWKAHNVVELSRQRFAVFEFVKDGQNSIANKFLMFSDLSKKEGLYSLNSVVKDIRGVSKRGAMLADVSNIIQLNASKLEFERSAEAA